MAHKKAGGSTRNGRDSQSKRLGLKCFGGAVCVVGLERKPDHTLFAKADGRVRYQRKGPKQRLFVSIVRQPG